MPLLLGQLVYTSFPGVGFRVLTSAQVPKQIQQDFIQQVVHRHWDAYNPPASGYQAAYLHQVTPEHNLFGWLYNDGLDDLGRDHVPYFHCYYLAERLHAIHLENIFTWLHQGPLALIDRHNPPNVLENILAPDASSYQPACVGVAIPSGVREQSQFALKQKKLLDIFVPLHEPGTVFERNEHYKQQAADDSIHESRAGSAVQRAAVTRSPLFVDPKTIHLNKRSQTTKIALLIGVSEYGPGLSSLPGAIKNVTALQQVLQQPQGGFAEVRTLLNPNSQQLAEALETLSEQAIACLLYFSGRGIQDDYGKLYFALSSSRLNQHGKLVKSSALAATFVQEIINDSRAQQAVILDCCWSSTLSDSDSWWVDIGSQLAAPGRVLLTATTTTSCYCQDNASESLYTRYLVEGLASGAADLDHDGAISMAELHDYTQRKVQIVTPAMQPQMFGQEQEQRLLLATAAIGEPQLQYRQAAERYVERGKFSLVGRSLLDVLRQRLELKAEAAAAIEAEVLQPWREYQSKQQRYVQELLVAMRVFGWSDATRSRCQQMQRVLGLLDADVAELTEQIVGQISSPLAEQPCGGSAPEASPASVGIEVPTVILSAHASTNHSSNSVRPRIVLSHRNSWMLVGVGIGISLTVVTSLLSAYVQLNEIRNLKIGAKYEECITKAEIKSWVAETFLYKDVQELLNECRLQQAKMLAADNKFSAAIKAAEKIPENSLLYPQAQQFIKEWSEI